MPTMTRRSSATNTEFMAAYIPMRACCCNREVSHFSFLQDPEQFTTDVLHFLQHVPGK